MRVSVLELESTPILVLVDFAAGGEAIGWNYGWDENYRNLHPGVVGTLYSIERAAEYGDQRFDLGPGIYPYKQRFATSTDISTSITWWVRHPWLQYLDLHGRAAAGRVLKRNSQPAASAAGEAPAENGAPSESTKPTEMTETGG
jgi:CelD/BcsL family acetyltransferase involved in cellulose biosynthesis